MNRRHYFKIEKIWNDIPQIEKEQARKNQLLIICKESNPKYPLMNNAVYDSTKDSPENLIAIFRNIDDAELFAKSLIPAIQDM